ncbi:histone acetyltransferase GCN5 [Ophiobolus disseminans]|uniref:Histone acetyltransferase GCN5 n=1 Tax=Ophiobolus disseminans TaxID=1469910 RepID=A0A6A6ZG05_9PLEO|nr:histone acetyltransferase GCN5 [Ophiobolus disseminans]
MQTEIADSQSNSAGSGQYARAAKRPAPEEVNDAPAAKRFESSVDWSDSPEIRPAIAGRIVSFPEKPAVAGEIEFRVVNNDGGRESTIILTGIKNLFQKQLPKMPKDYIAQLVYDRTHLSIAILKMPLEVFGGITYREFQDCRFAEIVFCAVSSNQQVKGYGAHIMAHLNDYVKATSPVMHFLTYADNFATGYFQKQGFTKEVTLPKSEWMGFIKDYEGGTLMQCTMLHQIRYLEAGRMLLKQKETVHAKIRVLSKSHVVHQPPQQWANSVVPPIDPRSVPAIQATRWSPEMDALAREPRRGRHFNISWPFLKPVDKDEVPDYYKTVSSPMDLTSMEERLESGFYTTPKLFIDDLKLVFCAAKLEKYMWSLVKETPEWYDLLGE